MILHCSQAGCYFAHIFSIFQRMNVSLIKTTTSLRNVLCPCAQYHKCFHWIRKKTVKKTVYNFKDVMTGRALVRNIFGTHLRLPLMWTNGRPQKRLRLIYRCLWSQIFPLKTKDLFKKTFIKSQIQQLYCSSFCAVLHRIHNITACYFSIVIKLSLLKPEIGYKGSVFCCAKIPHKLFFFL